MADQKLNIDVPEDCLKILKAYLEECNKKGVLSLEDAFLVNLALKKLSKYLEESHKSLPLRNEDQNSVPSENRDQKEESFDPIDV